MRPLGARSALLRFAISSLALLAGLWTALGPMPAKAQENRPLTVFAAASLHEAMEALGAGFAAAGGPVPVMSFAGTGTLARQIEAGAPADVFVSADAAWMDYVVAAAAVRQETVREIASNALVLVGPRDAAALSPTPDALRARLSGNRLAMADPDTVPAGRYGRAALESLGLWTSVETALAPMENVRVALGSVARGDTPLGLVYRTDALVEPDVAVLFEFPRESHPRIRYLAAITAATQNAASAAFLDYLGTPEAQRILRSFGFVADNLGTLSAPAD